MKKKWLKATIMCILLILVAFFLGAGFWLGKKIPFADQWPLFEALRTTASIIFAVVGAWLAIIYPERLRFSFGVENPDGTPQGVNMGKLLHPAIHSTMILCVILFVGIIAPLLKQLSFLLPYQDNLRGLSYALLILLTLWQVWTVILTLIPADIVKSACDSEQRKNETLVSFFSLTKNQNKQDPPSNP